MQPKVERIVLKAALHRGSDSSVLNDLLCVPIRTAWYVKFPSTWFSVELSRTAWYVKFSSTLVSVDGDLCFPPCRGRAP
jgi:hypothetical protein